MHKHHLLTVQKQKDTITLIEARKRIKNWQDIASQVYDTAESKKNMPHGFFIPFIDILELSKLQREISTLPGTDMPIYIVGVRAYYSVKNKMLDTFKKVPVSAIDYPVDAVMVPVYQTNPRIPGVDEYKYNPHFPTFDLIEYVASEKDADEPGDAGESSIYDVTQPCPNLCDSSSKLH